MKRTDCLRLSDANVANADAARIANENEEKLGRIRIDWDSSGNFVDEEERRQGNVEDDKVSCSLEYLQVQVDHFLSTLCIENEQKDEKSNDADEEEEEMKEQVQVVAVDIPSFIEKFLDLFMDELKTRDCQEGKGKWGREMENDCRFLEALDRVSKLIGSLDVLRSDQMIRRLVNLIGDIQQRAMCYLEEEFRQILEEILVNETVGEDADELFRYSDEAVLSMGKIVDTMITGGFESECCQVYAVIRSQALERTLSKTGFEKISDDEVQKMNWETLERVIPPWNMAFRECATVFFSKEKMLATSVFSKEKNLASSLFTNLARGVVIQLLNFAEAVAITKRSAEKLFKLLDMYETLRDSVKAFEKIFPDEEAGEELKTETFSVQCRIGEAAISMFCDLENSIKSDTGKIPVPSGAVHPLTRYTMNYLKYACEYKSTLEQVFNDHTNIEPAESNTGGASSPFAHQLIRIMDLLDSNLESKSKLYRDMNLSCIFIMNNGRYILQKIKGSNEIHDAVGDTWCRKKSSDIRNYHNTYKRETWTKLLGCLSHEGLQAHNKVAKPLLKERFKSFNSLFDEIHRTQSSWVVHDEQLRSELRVSISAVVIPAYRSFIGRFS